MGLFVKLGLIMVIPAVWTAIFGLVDVLPWGLEEVVQIISNTLHVVYVAVPLLETPIEFFLIGIGVKFTLITIDFLMWIMSLLR